MTARAGLARGPNLRSSPGRLSKHVAFPKHSPEGGRHLPTDEGAANREGQRVRDNWLGLRRQRAGLCRKHSGDRVKKKAIPGFRALRA